MRVCWPHHDRTPRHATPRRAAIAAEPQVVADQRTWPAPCTPAFVFGAGLDAHARDQARRYAELGYTVLACDMCHGAADPHGPMADVAAFTDEIERGQGRLAAHHVSPRLR
jgi:hypothetical protein